MENYRYPETKFTSLNNTARQLDHLRSEVTEAMEKLNINTLEEFFIEVCDIEHSLETLMRIIKREAGGIDWDWYRYEVIKKNIARGYYKNLDIEDLEDIEAFWQDIDRIIRRIGAEVERINNNIKQDSELLKALGITEYDSDGNQKYDEQLDYEIIEAMGIVSDEDLEKITQKLEEGANNDNDTK